jgi:tetratricopeptide (TPR) repeat protein
MGVALTERWDEVRGLFEGALDQAPADRQAWLATHCADAGLREEVESLLACHDRPHAMLDRPGALLETPADLALPAGYEIGPYRVDRLLGRGGMGAVYLAHRSDDSFDRQVAIKIVGRSIDTADALRRFLAERQTLAGLDHPHIAKLLDGGTTRERLPYFVMEYVDGLPIDAFCESRQLNLDQRLALFLRVAGAVQYAHQQLIVHRDLKPDNVLVRDDGEPRLLDFGIAKILPSAGGALPTVGPRALTPRYASPEQVRNEAIGTTSDVYSLGVLLYELVSGRPPHADPASHDSSWQIERAICELEPARPSDAARAAGCRWAERLSGDLDAIILMALRKEPERRYQSAAQFAEDLQRYRDARPVMARPDAAAYRARKFIGRNRVASLAAAAAVLALSGGIVLASSSARIARSEALKAQEETARARRLSEFLRTVIALPDPSWNAAGAGGRNDMTVVDLLNAAGGRIDRELGSDPETAADLHHTLGNTYRARGLFADAERHHRSALELRQRVLAPNDPKVAESLFHFGASQFWLGRPDVAERYYHEAIAIARTLPPAQAGQLPYMLLDLPSFPSYTNEQDAERVVTEAIGLFVGQLGPDHMTVGLAKQRLGHIELRRGHGATARRHFEEALAILRKQSASPLDEAAVLEGLASAVGMEGNLAEAERISREALGHRIAGMGADHPASLSNEIQLVKFLIAREQYSEARRRTDRVRAAKRRQPDTAGPTLAELDSLIATILTRTDPQVHR